MAAKARISIRTQLTLVIFAASFTVLLATASLFIYWQANQSRQQALLAAQSALGVLAQDFVRSIVLTSPDATTDMVLKLHAYPAITHVVFFDNKHNMILSYTQTGYERINVKHKGTRSLTQNSGFAEIYRPITYFKKQYGMAYFRVKSDTFNDGFVNFLKQLLIAIPLLLLLSFLLALYFQRFFTRPVRQLANSIRSFSHGISTSIPKEDANSIEIFQLFQGFNQMAIRIQQAQTELSAEKERLLITLESIADGVIATDEQGRIRYMNPSAEKITEWTESDALGQPGEKVYQLVDESTDQSLAGHIDEALVAGTVYFDLEHTALITQQGHKLAIQSSIAPIKNQQKQVTGVVIIFQNVSESRDLANILRHQATHDPLTDLLNRTEFEQRMEHTIRTTDEKTTHALLYLDLDQFKVINDTSGHAAGDALLIQIAVLLNNTVRESDTITRLGGDEFAIFLANCSPAQAEGIAEKIRHQISEFSFIWDNKNFKVSISIGLVSMNDPLQLQSEILGMADLACYAAKELGRNRVHIYQVDDKDLIERHGHMHWVSRINDALEKNQLLLFAQHMVPLKKDNLIEHYEVLIRYIDDEGAISFPGAFLPAVERYGLAAQLDRWVLRHTIGNKKLINYLNEHPKTRFNINLSGLTLSDSSLVDFVTDLLQKAKLPPKSICFEITETAAIANLSAASRFMRSMKLLGCQFALDDFGSGVSSFNYLKNLPVDYLKIDGSFIQDIAKNPTNLAMVKAINDIGHVIGITTIAESVETRDACKLLKDMGVDFAQGYFIHAPCPLEYILDGRAQDQYCVGSDEVC